MELEKSIQNLSEIINLCEDEINNNNINITATLDLEDLKSLKTVLKAVEKLKHDNYKLDKENQKLFEMNINSIPKKKIEDKIKEINNKIKQNEKELKRKPEPVGSGFGSFDEYFKWHAKVIHENELLKEEIKDIQELLEE